MKFLKFLNRHKGKIIFVLLLIAAAVYHTIYKEPKKVEEEILTHTLKKGTISQVLRKDGSISPKNSMEVNSSADGKIKEVLVKEGDTVKKGKNF